VGHAAPAKIQANSEILKAFPDRTEEEIVRLTGIRERRYAADDEERDGPRGDRRAARAWRRRA